MIQVQMQDGTTFHVEDAEVTFTVGEGEDAKTYGWQDLARIMLIDGGYGVSDGRFGGPQGMPIRGLVWTDTSDMRIEIPMPLEAAEDLGKALQHGTKVETFKTVPSGLVAAEKKPMWTPGDPVGRRRGPTMERSKLPPR